MENVRSFRPDDFHRDQSPAHFFEVQGNGEIAERALGMQFNLSSRGFPEKTILAGDIDQPGPSAHPADSNCRSKPAD